MRRHARRRGLLPLGCAVLLTLAAGLSLAEEQAWHHASAPPATPEIPTTATSHTSGKAAAVGKDEAGTASGVGSRALTGHEAEAPPRGARGQP